VLEEISAGVPIEETASEKTEEVSLSPALPPADAPLAVPEPFDLGGSDRPPSRDSVPSLKPKGSGKLIAGIAVLAAAAAFGAVYLAKTKPWQQSTQPEAPAVATPAPVPAPVPEPEPVAKPPAPEPAKPAEEVVAKKQTAEEAKVAAAPAEKTEPEKPAAGKPAAEKPAAEKPAAPKLAAENAATEKLIAEKAAAAKAEAESVSGKSGGKSGGKAGAKSGEEKAGGSDEEIYRLAFRSTPIGAEVLIDGEYFARTPCERRILDPKKSFAITIRREGYEPHERLLGPSDNWVKKGSERVLSVTVNLKKSSAPAAGVGSAGSAAGSAAPTASPEAKPVAAPPEPAKPTVAKPEAKPAAPEAAKPEAAKPAPSEKTPTLKPVPNFEEPGKAKE
jgi:hypothetical protein